MVRFLYRFVKDRGDSALHKHRVSDHEGVDMKFRMELTDRFRDPLTRQANEAVRISNRKKHELLNSKTEFNHPPIPRITVEGTPFSKKKFNQTCIQKNELNPKPTPVTQYANDDSSLSGTEVVFNHRWELLSKQKQLSSDQDNQIESTMLIL